jgi:hypothetical protein
VGEVCPDTGFNIDKHPEFVKAYKVWNGFRWCEFYPVYRGIDVKWVMVVNGKVFEMDSRHQVKVKDGDSVIWKTTKDIKEGDKICFSKADKFVRRTNVSTDELIVYKDKASDYDHHCVESIYCTDTTDNTYTLVVNDELHQFDSEGIISKNTAGNILKLTMIRLWDSILNNPKARDKVRFLSTVHDEINYSIKKQYMHKMGMALQQTMDFSIPEWPVDLPTEISFGWSWGSLFAFSLNEETNLFEPNLL